MDLISTIVVLIVTLAAIVAGFYAYGMSNLQEIKDNWVKYRCNPAYMPLAGAVGSDIMSNFTHCTMQSVQSYAGFVMDPIFNAFKQLQKVIKEILSSMQFIRKKIAGTTDAFLGIVSSVFGKIHNTLTVTAQLFGRIRTIMYRIMSIFVVLIHIVKTGIDTGSSIDKGPIGEVGRFLCFDPNTDVKLYSGETVKLCDIKPGNILSGSQEVLSVMMFDGSGTPMVNIDGIRVSGNHKIMHHNKWIHCSQHPDAIRISSLPYLICLNTSTHTIPIKSFLFKDYEETDDIQDFYEDVAKHYGTSVPPLRNTYRTTGFDIQKTKIRMSDDTVRDIKEVAVGDSIHKGGRVVGIIVHKQEHTPVQIGKGVFVAPGTMVEKEGVFTTAATPIYLSEPLNPSRRCMNFLTEHAMVVAVDELGNDYTFLDDQEVPTAGIHDKRDQKVVGS